MKRFVLVLGMVLFSSVLIASDCLKFTGSQVCGYEAGVSPCSGAIGGQNGQACGMYTETYGEMPYDGVGFPENGGAGYGISHTISIPSFTIGSCTFKKNITTNDYECVLDLTSLVTLTCEIEVLNTGASCIYREVEEIGF